MLPMNHFFKRLLADVLVGLTAGTICLLSPAVALAQRGGPPPPTEGHNDGLGYLLVLFCVALSMIILVRSSNRSPDVRLKELEEE
jgi:hypothetical protein